MEGWSGGGGRLGHVLEPTQFRPAFRTATAGADLAVDLHVLGKMSIRGEGGGGIVFNSARDKSWSVPALLSWLHSC